MRQVSFMIIFCKCKEKISLLQTEGKISLCVHTFENELLSQAHFQFCNTTKEIYILNYVISPAITSIIQTEVSLCVSVGYIYLHISI